MSRRRAFSTFGTLVTASAKVATVSRSALRTVRWRGCRRVTWIEASGEPQLFPWHHERTGQHTSGGHMGDQTPEKASPEVVDRVQASFDRQGLMRLLGAQLAHVAPGRVHIVLPCHAEVSQQHGYIHAGATGAIADTAGGYAALTLMPSTSEVLTVEYKLNLVAPAAGDHLEAIGTVLTSGRTLSICRLEVFAVGGDALKLVAAGQQTLVSVPGETGS
jgi:uncharacterized protein (TIGR00369 family)